MDEMNDWEDAQIEMMAAAQESGEYRPDDGPDEYSIYMAEREDRMACAAAPDGPVYGDWGPGVEYTTVKVTHAATWKKDSVKTDKTCPECNGPLFYKAGAPYPYWCRGCGGIYTETELTTGKVQPF